MSHIEVQCPSCSKRLRISSEHAGKTIRCPACRNTLEARPLPPTAPVAPASPRKTSESATQPPAPRKARRITTDASDSSNSAGASPPNRSRSASPGRTQPVPAHPEYYEETIDETIDESFDVWDKPSAEGDESDPYPWTAPAPASTSTRKSKPRKANGALSFLLLWIASFVGLCLLCGVGYLVFTNLPGLGGNFTDLSYMPEHLTAVLYVEPASLLKTEIAQDYMRENPIQRNVMAELQPEDVASITFGAWKDNTNVQMPGPLAAFGAGGGWVAVTRTTKATAPSPQYFSQGETYKGETLWMDRAGIAHWFDGSYTIIVGAPAAVKQAIDRGSAEQRQPQLDFAPTSGQIIVAFGETSGLNPSLANTPFTQFPGSGGSPLETLLRQETKGLGLSLSFESGIEIDSIISCRNEGSARSIHDELQKLLQTGKSQLDLVQNQPGAAGVQAVLSSAKDLLNQLKLTQSSSQVSASLTIPRSTYDQFRSLQKSTENRWAPGPAGMRPPGF